jgi:nicotinamidase-related amidase
MPIRTYWVRGLALAAPCVITTLQGTATLAAEPQSIMDTWSSVAIPPPPPLLQASVDSSHAALLILDMNTRTCTADERPTCLRSIPVVKRLLDEARAKKMLVVYTTGPATRATPAQTPESLTPRPDEPIVRTGADKFVNSDLDKILAAKAIKTVIVVGTSAQGAVLYTASGAALRGMEAVVPVDGFSSEEPFAELYTAWHLKNAPPTISSHITLTKSSLITIH